MSKGAAILSTGLLFLYIGLVLAALSHGDVSDAYKILFAMLILVGVSASVFGALKIILL